MKKLYIIVTVLISFGSLKAQDFGSFLEGGEQIGSDLMQAYLEPAFTGFGYALNSGWYNTAKPHKIAGFDITIGASLALVPSSAELFDPSGINGIGVNPAESGETLAPTLMGDNLDADDIPYLIFNEGTEDEISITSPTGIGMAETVVGFNAVPAPVVQIGFGLIKNTEIKLRLVPEQTFDIDGNEGSTKLFGIGVMHDIKQWIPGISKLPFDLSVFGAYSKMTTSYQLDADSPDQIGNFEVTGTTFQLAISKKLSILTLYGGVGYSSSTVKFNLEGDYYLSSNETEGTPSQVPDFIDPISLEYDASGFRAKAGLRLKLLIVTVHAEYVAQEYGTFNTGIGISIR
ncbi:MAG: hypothetical protein ACI81G_001527 [Gammaproteobacteria bacterium]|jgi:hypothetical protein